MIGTIAAVAVLIGVAFFLFAVISEIAYQIAMRRADRAEARNLETAVAVQRTRNA